MLLSIIMRVKTERSRWPREFKKSTKSRPSWFKPYDSHILIEPTSLRSDCFQDVGKLEDSERMVQEAIDGLGGLDIIISNAVGPAVQVLPLRLKALGLCQQLCSIRDGQSLLNLGISTL